MMILRKISRSSLKISVIFNLRTKSFTFRGNQKSEGWEYEVASENKMVGAKKKIMRAPVGVIMRAPVGEVMRATVGAALSLDITLLFVT